jgi:hypothetical protein
MHAIQILTKQTEDAYDWVNKLVDSIPYEHWEDIPEVLETNVSWQVGHLIMSFYYHSILVISGHQMDIIQQVPLKIYDDLFTDGPPEETVGKSDPEVLKKQLLLVQQKSITLIESLSETDLLSPLMPTPTPHPIAKNKFEALDWNIKHTMYHCGQIGILKRIINGRYDFGLKRG